MALQNVALDVVFLSCFTFLFALFWFHIFPFLKKKDMLKCSWINNEHLIPKYNLLV